MPAKIILPTAPRYVAVQAGDSLRVTLPSRKHWLLLIVNSLMILVWMPIFVIAGGFGGVAVLESALIRHAPVSFILFGLGFFILWFGLLGAISLTALYTVLWNLAGREVIEVSRQSIRIKRVVPGWARTKEYLAEHIRDLRVSPQSLPSLYRQPNILFGRGMEYGQMAFDYGARTVRFADADEAEIKMILAEILRQFPQYGGGASSE